MLTGAPVAEAARKHEISEQTIYNWRQKFGAPERTDGRRLRALEAENAELKRMLADCEMGIDTLKEINRRKRPVRGPSASKLPTQ